MAYGLTLVSSGTEPIDLVRAKLHLRIDWPDEDAEITLLIKAVRKFFEKHTGQVYATSNWTLTLDQFSGVIHLPKSPPIPAGQVAVNWVKYLDGDGALQTVAAADYQVDTATLPARITPAYSHSWPIARSENGAVRVNFTVTPTVDEDVLAGMLLLLSHWNNNREAVLSGGFQEVPLGVSAILALNWDGAYGCAS